MEEKELRMLKEIIKFFGTDWLPYEERKVEHTEIDGYIVSTVFVNDWNCFETAIETPTSKKWIIVERYETKELAIKGHKDYVKMIKLVHPKEFYDIIFKEYR